MPPGTLSQVQDKFLLNLSEEEAIKAFEVLLHDTSYVTAFFDHVHTLAQAYRS
jgi:phosphatidylinositol 3-kinase